MISVWRVSVCDTPLWYFFFVKQKTAYEMRISDWSSDCALPICVGIEQWSKAVSGGGGRWRDHPGAAEKTVAHGEVHAPRRRQEIGRASCRERVCQYV